MDDILELITALEKIIEAEKDWNKDASKLSERMYYHDVYRLKDPESPAVPKIIKEMQELASEQLAEAYRGLIALKEFYEKTAQTHRAGANYYFNKAVSLIQQGKRFKVRHNVLEKERAGEEIYKNCKQTAKALEQKLSKEQIKAITYNKELDEESLNDLNKKLSAECQEYRARFPEMKVYSIGDAELKLVGPDFPILSQAKNYKVTCVMAGLGIDDYEEYGFLISITDQLAILQGERMVRGAEFRLYQTVKEATLHRGHELIHKYTFEAAKAECP